MGYLLPMTSSTATRTATAPHNGETFKSYRKAAQFMSFYTSPEVPGHVITVEHNSEAAAIKGSWQSADMRKAWAYRGYAPIA